MATGPVLAWTFISITWKDPPTIFPQKISGSRDRKIPLKKRVSVSLRAATPPSRISAAATAAPSENFGHGGVKRRDVSLGIEPSEKTEGTLPEELERAEAIPGVYRKRQSDRMTNFSRFSKKISRTIDRSN